MSKYVYLLVWLIAASYASDAVAVQQCHPQLRFSFKHLTVSEPERRRLDALFATWLSRQNAVISDYQQLLEYCAPGTTITLTDNPDQHPNKVASRFQLPSVPAFAQFTVTGNDSENALLTQRHRPYNLKLNKPAYTVDDNQAAITLLQAGRASAVIDYAVNLPMYAPLFDDLEVTPLEDTTPIYLLFRQPGFRDLVDAAVAHYLDLPDASDDTPVASPSDTPVRWLVLNKYFSQTKDALIPLQAEIDIVNHLATRLDGYHFTVAATNGAAAMTQLQSSDNVCVMGVYQTAERDEFALFSEPVTYFLSPRLYLRDGVIPSSQVAQYINRAGVLDATSLLAEHSEIAIGYSPDLLKLLPTVSDYLTTRPRRFLQLDGFEREHMLALFVKGRLNGFIDFPSHLAQARQRFSDMPDVSSYAVVPKSVVGHARSACSNSATGRAVIDALNALLGDPASRAEFMTVLAKDMLPVEQQLLHRAAGTEKQMDTTD